MALTAERYFSFPVSHVTKSDDGDDLYVEGLATDGQLDHDMQVIDQGWANKAFAEFFATGANIRASHRADQPIGVGVDWRQDHRGIWVKSCIVDPVAQRMVRKGVLRAYSVGISWPTVVPDPIAKGGKIAGGTLSELSLVDRPSNARCGVTIASKSAATGQAFYIGKAWDGKAARKAGKKAGRVRKPTEAELLAIGVQAVLEVSTLEMFAASSDPVIRLLAAEAWGSRGKG